MRKRRTKGEGSVRKRADGIWEARATLPNGVRKSYYGRTRKEATDRMNDAIDEILSDLEAEDCGMSVGEWLDVWLSEFLQVKHNTKCRYELDIRRHLKPELGNISLGKLTTLDIQKMYNKKEAEGLSLKSIKNMHGVLHAALEQAVACEYIDKNVSKACKLKPPVRKQMTPIVDEHLSAFLAAIEGDVYEDILYIYTFTGMRRSEALGLTWDCVDFKKGTIHVYRQWVEQPHLGGSTTYTFSTPKNGKDRVITPAVQVMERLAVIKEKQEEYKAESGAAWENRHDFVFTTSTGHPYNGDCVYKHFKKIVKSIGLEEVRLHDLRHTFATLSLQSGTDVKTVSASLGHATAAFTLDRYSHVSQTMQKEAARNMDRLIASVEQKENTEFTNVNE